MPAWHQMRIFGIVLSHTTLLRVVRESNPRDLSAVHRLATGTLSARATTLVFPRPMNFLVAPRGVRHNSIEYDSAEVTNVVLFPTSSADVSVEMRLHPLTSRLVLFDRFHGPTASDAIGFFHRAILDHRSVRLTSVLPGLSFLPLLPSLGNVSGVTTLSWIGVLESGAVLSSLLLSAPMICVIAHS